MQKPNIYILVKLSKLLGDKMTENEQYNMLAIKSTLEIINKNRIKVGEYTQIFGG